MSKWHPKILQRHPKFRKPRYVFALHRSKMIWGKHVFLRVAIATDICNVISQLNFLAQKLKAKIVSMVSVHCHEYRLASACYYTAADLYSVACETAKALAIMKVFYYFTVAIGLPYMHQTTMKTKGRQLQRACKARRLSSEATARAEWDFDYLYLGHIEAAVRKYQWWSARCFTATSENEKFQHYRTEQSMSEPTKVFQAGCLNLAQMKASVELCINKLSNTDAKTEI